MKTNDISIAYISWNGGGKKDQFILFLIVIIRFASIKLPPNMKINHLRLGKNYFKIGHWKEAGLNKQSYIDTITVGKIDKRKFNLRIIGRLSKQDAEKLVMFLNNQD
ncbi:hypothetical protein [Limosilactobacillus caviae]|uniref:hypothetical protein n=1 Tax=Limosilactobacillus caviae TaxID=1769424 RepID=UPI0035177E94